MTAVRWFVHGQRSGGRIPIPSQARRESGQVGAGRLPVFAAAVFQNDRTFLTFALPAPAILPPQRTVDFFSGSSARPVAFPSFL